MAEKELKGNSKLYEKRFLEGYGLRYPDGHVIRFHRHVLEYELGVTKGRIIDYGCGNGSHLKYFEENGFTPYGCDINELAIRQAKELLPAYSENLHVTPSLPDLAKYFTGSFDVVFANQVLYFLDNRSIDSLLDQFWDLLRPGGVFFATMIAETNYFTDFITMNTGEMSEVRLSGRLNQTMYINFKSARDVLNIFSRFDKLHIGTYSHQIREDEGATDHHIFVGIKPRV